MCVDVGFPAEFTGTRGTKNPKLQYASAGRSPSFPIHALVSYCSQPAQGVLGSAGEGLSCRAELHPAGFILLGGTVLLFVTSSPHAAARHLPALPRFLPPPPPAPSFTIFGDFLRLMCAPRSKTSSVHRWVVEGQNMCGLDTPKSLASADVSPFLCFRDKHKGLGLKLEGGIGAKGVGEIRSASQELSLGWYPPSFPHAISALPGSAGQSIPPTLLLLYWVPRYFARQVAP